MSSVPPHPSFISSIDVVAGVPPIAQPVGGVGNEHVLIQLQEVTRALQQLVAIDTEMLQLARRNEERIRKQIQMQREEFDRWLNENKFLSANCRKAEETIRVLLGQAISDLVRYAEEQGDDLIDSDYVRTDLVDRFGSMLNHVSAMYGILKRMGDIQRSNNAAAADSDPAW